jgi:TRAP transporter TAXI family solute receptor
MRFWCALACAAVFGTIAAADVRADDPVRIAQAHNAAIGLVAGNAGSTDTQLAAEMAQVMDDGAQLRVLPILGQGAVQNIADLIFLKGVDVAIVHADALAETLQAGTLPRVESVEYIAKLVQEEVHVLAQDKVAALADLEGKPVETGPADSGTALTAATLLGALHIHPESLHDSLSVALERLRLGEAAAVIVVGGKPVPALLAIPAGSGLHFLTVPLNARLLAMYMPTRLDSQQYPNLLPPGQAVDTVAVGSMLVTLSAQSGTLRRQRVDRFVDRLFARFDALRQPGFHPKWHEVSLSAQIPGLRRYNEADKLLRLPSTAEGGRERHSGP